MAFELKQNLKLSQQMVMTPQLQQAIKLLQLNRMELVEHINQELVENPVLEELGEGEAETPSNTADPEAEQKRDEESFAKPAENAETLTPATQDTENWESYLEEMQTPQPQSAGSRDLSEELPSFESVLTKTTTLEEHLRWQLSMSNLAEHESKLGELIIGNLNEDGYLVAPFEDLAREAGMTDLEDAEALLKLIQNFDPIGVASRSLQECLLSQAKLLSPRQPLVEKLIEHHLADLERKNYSALAKNLNLPLNEVHDATRVILEFEPKPGRSFHGTDTQYITPDIYVYKVGQEFVIVLNEDGLPKLRVSPYYKNILMEAKHTLQNKDKKPTSDQAKNQRITKEYVQEKLKSAIWLIRSIHNRQKTIYKVTEAIVTRQKDFFEKGVQALKPMILKDVANDIGMHESTVSRVTTNKYVHTPVGIFELKYFFNSSIASSDGSDALASEAVKEKIRQLVSKENPKAPLSDQAIVEALEKDNIHIARRTIAKYRDILGILPSSKRKQTI
jgi:RNA polymerase sigma-54 factor